MTYFIDIDGTICTTQGNDYEHSIPIKENIDKANKLFDEGNIVIYWTSRGQTSGKNWQLFTINQLYQWGCRYNSLRMDKPSFDVLIDDKAMKL